MSLTIIYHGIRPNNGVTPYADFGGTHYLTISCRPPFDTNKLFLLVF